MIIKFSLRNIWRQRSRAIAILATVSLGLSALMIYHGFNAGIMNQYRENTIRARFGHGQVNTKGYRDQIWDKPWLRWIDPASPSVREEAAALSWLPVVKGVRPVKDDNRTIAWMLDARNAPGWKTLAECGLSLDILVQNWRELPLAIHLARKNPGLSIILDHCGKPDIANGQFQKWADHISELAALPHVNCKLSGLMNCAAPGATARDIEPYARHVLASFGARRVMWASDWPPLDLASDYATWWQVSQVVLAFLDERDRADVLSGTASRIYRLSD